MHTFTCRSDIVYLHCKLTCYSIVFNPKLTMLCLVYIKDYKCYTYKNQQSKA